MFLNIHVIFAFLIHVLSLLCNSIFGLKILYLSVFLSYQRAEHSPLYSI